MKIYTESSLYEFDLDKQLCRRTSISKNTSQTLREDGKWVRYFAFEYKIGEPISMMLENLDGNSEQVTFRTTSPVVKVEL